MLNYLQMHIKHLAREVVMQACREVVCSAFVIPKGGASWKTVIFGERGTNRTKALGFIS